MQTTKTSPYVNELNGRKIVFVKMNDKEASTGLQCYNCIMNDEKFCEHLRNEAGDDMVCEDDLGAVWKFADEVAQEPTTEEPLVNAAEPALGRKFDSGKPRYSLIPPNALEEVARVLTYGSQKYEDHNWLRVDNANDRFFSAANRHMWAWKKGEKIDEENQCSHLAAAIASLMFILELEFIDGKNKTTT